MECDVVGKTGRLDIVEIDAITAKTRLGVRVAAGAGFNDNRCLDRIRKATQMPLNDMTRMQQGKKKNQIRSKCAGWHLVNNFPKQSMCACFMF